MSLVRVSTGVRITPKIPKTTLDTQYPITWFRENKTKPVLNIFLTTESLKVAACTIKKQITDNSVDIDAAKTFLYLFTSQVTGTLDADWVSYGISIGTKDETINPSSLLKVNKVIRNKEMAREDATDEDIPWMAGFLLGIYRLIRATVNEYKTQISRRITLQLKALCPKSPEMTDVVDIYAGWVGDKEYNTLVAAYDMFLHKFNKHPFANLRIGTTGSRFRDCAALISYGYLMDCLAFRKTTDVMDWVFVEKVGEDIDRMMSSDDEIEDDDSYFPYHVDFGLVQKSSYSASANPHFFEWVHMTGALLQNTRSMNAKHITDSQALVILGNAACLAYAFHNTFEFTKVYTSSGDPIEDSSDSGDEEELDVAGEILNSRDPSDWLKMLKSMNGSLPDKVKKFVKKAISLMKEPRAGTIEEHLARSGKIIME